MLCIFFIRPFLKYPLLCIICITSATTFFSWTNAGFLQPGKVVEFYKEGKSWNLNLFIYLFFDNRLCLCHDIEFCDTIILRWFQYCEPIKVWHFLDVYQNFRTLTSNKKTNIELYTLRDEQGHGFLSFGHEEVIEFYCPCGAGTLQCFCVAVPFISCWYPYRYKEI